MQSDRHRIGILFLFLIFILGGFLGIGIWMALIPVCMAVIVKAAVHGLSGTGGINVPIPDWCVIGICVAEVLACIFSINITNSVKASAPVITLAFFWFFFKETSNGKDFKHFMAIGGTLLSLLFSLMTIGTFIHFKTEFAVCDADITNFKQEYSPMGMAINDWTAFLLCSLPYPFTLAEEAEHKHGWLLYSFVSALLTASIVLSLSRGAYIALAVFYLITMSSCVSSNPVEARKRIGKIAVSALLGFALVIPASREVLTTCAMSRTTSQKLSAHGRVQLVDDCIEIWKERPVTGVGAGNFNIVYDSRVIDRKASSTRATNTYALILVEKGAIGMLAYSVFVVTLMLFGLKDTRRWSESSFFYACFVALCVRGVFFSSLFEHRAVLMMVMLVIFGLILGKESNEV